MKNTRRIVALTALLLMLSAGFLVGQTLEIAPNDSVLEPVPIFDGTVDLSLYSNVSFNVFRNELDAAFSVDETRFGPTFSTLDQRYLFAGLTNLNRATAVTALDTPLYMGYFQPGGMPWSVVFQSMFVNAANNLGRSTDRTVNPGAITFTEGGVDYVYDELVSEERTTYRNVLADEADVRAQFLTRIADINTGLYLRYFVDNDTAAPLYDPADNFSRETDFFYDAANDPGNEEPDPQPDYTETETARDFGGRTRTMQIAVPAFLQTGNLTHTVRLGLSLERVNNSTSQEVSFTNPADSTFTDTVVDSSTTDVDRNWSLGTVYTLGLPGVLGSDEGERLNVSLDLGVSWWGGSYEDRQFSQTVDYAPNASPVEGNITKSEEDRSYSSALGFELGVLATHPLYYDIGTNAVFGIEPSLGFGWTRDVLAADRRYISEQVARAYDVNGDLTSTTTTTAERVGSPRFTDDWFTVIGLPMALDIDSDRLPFGVVLGARPQLTHMWERTQTNAPGESTTVVVTDADGNVTSDERTTEQDPGKVITVESQWIAGMSHNMGFYFDITEEIRLDFALNASNLLSFENFTIQAIFAMP